MKAVRKFLHDNLYVILGFVIGLYVSSLIQDGLSLDCRQKNDLQRSENQQILRTFNNSVPVVNPPKKTPDTTKKVVRPRYYSTELGIREKMFVGIFTSEEKVNSHAVHLNKTIGHIVDKIKFFITAQYKLKSKFNLTGLVGFTDSRTKFRPFQVVKYVGDSFAQDYDYYFFANDYTFINIHRLKDLVSKISVSMDVYMGTKVQDSSYCSFDSGILISNSVLREMRKHLDWCIINTVSDDNSENFGRCVYHSIGMNCQESVQEISLKSYKLKHFELNEHLLELSSRPQFNEVVTVHPVMKNEDFYLLNAYFLRQRLELIKQQTDNLSKLVQDSWPPGQRVGAKPATRFDLPRQYYFNMSHVFFPDDFTVIRPHNEPELKDIEYIIDEITSKVANNDKYLLYRRLVNGYKTFDLSRGMDYAFDLAFRDLNTGKEIIKRFEVCKPLGNVEFVQVPYVTENTKVAIILPVQETELELANQFLDRYNLMMEKKEKTFLLLVFLYQFKSGQDPDVFSGLKERATQLAQKFRNDDTKIAWLSIQLPEFKHKIYTEDYPSLNFAMADLALKKLGLESLCLFLDVHVNITGDFLNRVRMNTIPEFQIFNPIPFRQYNPLVTNQKSLDVQKSVGHFDREEYKYISFYGKDYVTARKKYQHILPLTRVDNDITALLDDDIKNTGNIFEMFVKYYETLHCMRATEMNLRVLYHDEKNLTRSNWFIGSEMDLAKSLIAKEIPEIS